MKNSDADRYDGKQELAEQFLKDTLAAWDDFQATKLHVTGEEVYAWLDSLEAGKICMPPKCHI